MKNRHAILLLLLGLVSCLSPRYPDDGDDPASPSSPLLSNEEVLRAIAFPSEPGQHQLGDWIYQYEVIARGTRSEQRIGVLAFEGIAVAGSVGEIKTTPLGEFLYLDRWRDQGWLNTCSFDRPVFDKAGTLTGEMAAQLKSARSDEQSDEHGEEQ
jgi:hypothetical protein